MRKLIVIFAVMALFAFPTHSQSACPDLNDVITGLRIVSDISVSSIPAIDIDNNSKFGLPEIVYMLQIIAGLRECYGYAVVDTGQSECYDASTKMTCPASSGAAFYGQDAQYSGKQPSYSKSSDETTVYDDNTGLTWMSSPNMTPTNDPVLSDKKTYSAALTWVNTVNAAKYGGYSDWRLPTIKELYSLIKFNGTDPSTLTGTATGLTPFIDNTYFKFAYGQGTEEDRIIDSQYASSTLYVSNTANDGGSTLFGVNFADGRIKGYGLTMPGGKEKTFFVQLVRGNTSYGKNSFTLTDGNTTVTDSATELMWSRDDSVSGMTWQAALDWVKQKNSEKYLGYSDWRLPNAKELQSIVDYTLSPDTTKPTSAAIDPVFNCTKIKNEAGNDDYPWYWAGTTHVSDKGTGAGVYIAFGRALGWQLATTTATCYTLYDVHGAGSQRSDPKTTDKIEKKGTACSGGTAYGHGPQGDVQRALNYVRLVRGG